jgi:hypothetical protein
MTEAKKPKRTRKSGRKPKTDAGAAIDTGAVNLNAGTNETSSSTPAAKADSKTARVIALLQRQEGASVDELVAETGWQSHTTRAALTGLRKKGHAISSEKVDGVRRYHAAAAR